MAEIVLMPKLTEIMTAGNVIQSSKKIGDQVEVGDVIVMVETDKATFDYESSHKGTLLYLVEGYVKVNDVLAIIGNKDEDYRRSLAIFQIKAKALRLPDVIADCIIYEAHIGEWYKNTGDTVQKGEPVVKIITGIYTIEYESPYDGNLLYQSATAGAAIQPNDVVAIVGEPDADWQTLLKCYP